MGMAKEMQMAAAARGFGFVEGHVCPECVEDLALKACIEADAAQAQCDFCGRRADTAIAADADGVVDHIARSIKTEYDLAVNVLGWDGGFIGTCFDMPDLLDYELPGPLVVDLSDIPPLPSIFDDSGRHMRSSLLFLHGFRDDLVRPIEQDGREHIEYVPTQVVTEYLRLIYRLPDPEPASLDGLMFTSARGQGTNVVLFVEPEACLNPADPSGDEGMHLRLRRAHRMSLTWNLRTSEAAGQ